MIARMTVTEQMLSAAGDLAQPFTPEELLVALWRAYPEQWALKGFPAYPDNNKLSAALWHKKGPVHAGLFTRSGERRFRVQMTARQWALQRDQTRKKPPGRPRKPVEAS